MLGFGEQSDPLAGQLKALLLHLHSREPQAVGRAAQLSPALEVSCDLVDRQCTDTTLQHQVLAGPHI